MATAAAGKWFHTFKNGEVQYQGQLLEQRGGRYLVQRYSFATIEPNGTPFWVAEADLGGWTFYESALEMRTAYEAITPGLKNRT